MRKKEKTEKNNKEKHRSCDTFPVKQTVELHKVFSPQLIINQLRIFL